MTGIRLRALLRHPTWSAVRDLSGLDADPALSASAIIRDLHDELPPAAGGLLVVLYSADRSDWRLDVLLSRAARSGTAAVVLEGDEQLLTSTSALARRLTLPVLGTADPLSAHQAFLRLSGEGDIEAANLTLRALSRASQAGPDVEDVLRRVTSALGRPVGLVDGHGTVLAGEFDGFTGIAEALPAVPPSGSAGLRLDLPGDALLLVQPLRVTGSHAWLVARVPVQVDVELRALETALIAVAPVMEQRLTLARMLLERDARRRASVLGEVLQGPITAATRRRALDLGWELDGWHTSVHIGAADDIDLAGRRADVTSAFEAEQVEAVVVEHGEGWAVWTTSRQEPTATEVQASAAAIRSVHRRLQAMLATHVGVGRPYPGPEGIGRSLTEATDAGRLAKNRPESGQFLHIDRLGLAQLLLAWTRTDTFQPAARSLLAPLADISSELIPTLAAYLDAESSLTETAGVLGVHRNTVSARIARIESVLGVDLSVPDDRLALHLACRTALGSPDLLG